MNWDMFVKVYEMFRGMFDAFINLLKNLFGGKEDGSDNSADTTVA